jgi:hypothetical protein
MSSPQQACPQQHSTDEHAEFLVDSARYGDKEDVASALERGTPADARDGQARTGASERHVATALPPVCMRSGASLAAQHTGPEYSYN